MKWFKHDTDANMDAKLQEVLLDYGLEGYGLYWYCLELIASNVTSDNLTFELEHDCRIIARNTGSTVQKVQEMMTRFVDIGLFNNVDSRIICLKLAQRCDDFTAKVVKRKGVQAIDNQEVRQSPTKSDFVPLEVEVEVEVEVEKKSNLAQSADATPAEFYLILNDKTYYPITTEQIDHWLELYPAVNIRQQIRNMIGWVEANPTKRKTKTGAARFIVNWLAREQDKGGQRNETYQPANAGKGSAADRARAAIEERRAQRASILPGEHRRD